MMNRKIITIFLIVLFLPLTSYAHEIEIVEIQETMKDWSDMVFIDDEELFVNIDKANQTIYLESESGKYLLISPEGIVGKEGIMDCVCDLLFSLCQKLYFIDKLFCLIAVYLDCIMG